MTLLLKFKTSRIEDTVQGISGMGLSIYEMHSAVGARLRRVNAMDRIEGFLDQCGRGQFGLYKPEHGGKIDIETIRLKDGRTRETLGGWGIIQLLVERSEGIYRYDYSANTKARAMKWHSAYPEYGDPGLWKWDEILKSLRRLKKAARQGGADGTAEG